ncbi:MAG: asparagine synthase (glutamine-hydrolyzing) [Pseudodesulfovibrio sp.]|uniref:asparagine synthase (glutamine-hydrolyzing) n=1 Tax=Pseudodesulfovibrio aespoeensis (strain ATCC 700646 / DSM 10631 / Aspo-2) TaxID=643562 RepID=E6VSF4_PSEA9|nr:MULTISPECIES: asparagine synthase (glutamine-hydrolyzing) [Pseudodesulfovibrio]MBU4191317.1 asparagine synthase (glutamine-hydrolyzing) [Pseudomonadota bacterium]ADU64297.1 asparagine synthase (glutamine-hydrolyzing) [Pseudodesulfovibrio aespoeensis Aspo-2]MBU4242922.1 asparagine synthase (glutamine-hydrolyzing) [Pseudomonadota bacterium]MBU4378964.1 asparagine synthase (glutamine-hydrolyzing) [Pseudomonadota bacterium]MBU4474223.1 asparagine synthase (glutamine-hydrolyzing) [Pseudomonadota
MCGIIGFLDPGLAGDAQGARRLAGRMALALAHRGPDGFGEYADPAVGLGLGHRRLAIIDVSEAGAQPMASRDGRFVLTYNGELYNYRELRRELDGVEGSHLPWRGDSDTEVLLAACQVWGVRAALGRAVGMFALGLWDGAERVLVLARDRMGEKPLYYGMAGRAFVFASELKALRAHPAFEAGLDMESLALFLRCQYVPAPRSIYKDARKLLPGHLLEARPGDAALPEPEAYWTLRRTVERALADPFRGGEDEARDRLEALLRGAVAGQMVSDVPLGALLSGGVDSSLVTALMQAESSRPVRSFTIGFSDANYDESADAARVAAHLGTEHTALFVTPADVLGLVDALPNIYDEPFSDASQLPTCMVSRLTRSHVTVCLTGDGGDELFAGYNRHVSGPAIWDRVSRLPVGLRGALGSAMRLLSPGGYDALFRVAGRAVPGLARVRTPGLKAHKLADALPAADREDLYWRLVSTWHKPGEVLAGGGGGGRGIRPDMPELGDFTRWMQYADTATYLPGDILHKVDRATMAVSLESRAPYLDHRVAEFAWRLPVSMLVAGGQGKRILRRVLDNYVPRALVDRPKAGFDVPLDRWLRGPLKAWAAELLAPDRLRRQGLFNEGVVARQLADHASGRRDNQYRLWNLLMFQAWLERWTPGL